jgi:hypothetical protein
VSHSKLRYQRDDISKHSSRTRLAYLLLSLSSPFNSPRLHLSEIFTPFPENSMVFLTS